MNSGKGLRKANLKKKKKIFLPLSTSPVQCSRPGGGPPQRGPPKQEDGDTVHRVAIDGVNGR